MFSFCISLMQNDLRFFCKIISNNKPLCRSPVKLNKYLVRNTFSDFISALFGIWNISCKTPEHELNKVRWFMI